MNSMENAHLGLPQKVNVCKFFHKNLKKKKQDLHGQKL